MKYACKEEAHESTESGIQLSYCGWEHVGITTNNIYPQEKELYFAHNIKELNQTTPNMSMYRKL